MQIRDLKKLDNIKLNLGCGEHHIFKGFINVDLLDKEGIFKYDLNKFPYPFKDNSAVYILAANILEHLDDPIGFMLEVHRIGKKDSIVDIWVPHFSLFANNADLTHQRPGLSYLTFGTPYWNKVLYDKFKVVSKKLYFTRSNFKFLNYVFNPLLNINPVFYERFCAYIFPCSQIHFQLKIIKD